MIKFITSLTIALSLLGCGGSAAKSDSLTTQDDVVSQNVELMDLRSSVIILQSEIITLKENLKIAEELNRSLKNRIEEKVSRLSVLENYPNRNNALRATKNFPPGNKSEDVDIESIYKKALALYFESNYEESIKTFEYLINIDDSHELSDNAQYWIGESYFGIGNYARALSAFEIVLTYPQSNKNDYAQFKIGLCLLKMKRELQAYSAFQSFLDSYPDSVLVSRVIELKDRIQ